MAINPTVSELRKATEITNQEIDAAADAYLADPKAAAFRFASGYEIDAAAAVNAHQPAQLAVADPDRTPKFKRTMVRTAILLGVRADDDPDRDPAGASGERVTVAPHAARARKDTPARVLAVLTPELMTTARIAELARIPGRERKQVALATLERLERDGLAVRVMGLREPRWLAASPRSGRDSEAETKKPAAALGRAGRVESLGNALGRSAGRGMVPG
jgi:hypothetical protein